jgi:hypothetical protein
MTIDLPTVTSHAGIVATILGIGFLWISVGL